MAGDFLNNISGKISEIVANITSAGAADAGKLIKLDATGRLDSSVMPTGIGADTTMIQASEALAAGDFVNIHDVGGAFRIRKADATTAGKQAHGFVLSAVALGAQGEVHFEGENGQVTGQVPGECVWLSTTPGLAAAASPNTTGNVSQILGVPTSATSINVEFQPIIVIA